MKNYVGNFNENYELMVFANEKPLDPRLDLATYSPQGFACGYGGLGAAQLALAILADYLGNDSEALVLHDQFKWKVVAKLPRNNWSLTSKEISHFIQFICSARSAKKSIKIID